MTGNEIRCLWGDLYCFVLLLKFHVHWQSLQGKMSAISRHDITCLVPYALLLRTNGSLLNLDFTQTAQVLGFQGLVQC
jgi:hypothetical protein